MRFKIICFLKCERDATVALSDILVMQTTPSNLKLGAIRTIGGAEYDGPRQPLLDKPGIRHECTST